MAFGKWHKYKKGLRRLLLNFEERPPPINSFKRNALSNYLKMERAKPLSLQTAERAKPTKDLRMVGVNGHGIRKIRT